MQTESLSIISEQPGRVKIGALNNFLDLVHITGKCTDYKAMLIQLLQEHETIIRSLRKNMDACDERKGSTGTTNFLNSLIKQHQSIVDILKRYMDKTSPNNVDNNAEGLENGYAEGCLL